MTGVFSQKQAKLFTVVLQKLYYYSYKVLCLYFFFGYLPFGTGVLHLNFSTPCL
jgi:hypothetical protein